MFNAAQIGIYAYGAGYGLDVMKALEIVARKIVP